MKVVEQIVKSGIQLEARQVSNRGLKFGIAFGKAVLRKFKSLEDAQIELYKNRSLYEYYSGTPSVMNQNVQHIIINTN